MNRNVNNSFPFSLFPFPMFFKIGREMSKETSADSRFSLALPLIFCSDVSRGSERAERERTMQVPGLASTSSLKVGLFGSGVHVKQRKEKRRNELDDGNMILK